MEADDLFPESSFDDIVPQPAQNFRMSTVFKFVGGRPRSPSVSPTRKPKVIVRALLVADHEDWKDVLHSRVYELMSGRESQVTASLKEPGYKAFWASGYKRVKEEDLKKPLNDVLLGPFLETVRNGDLIPGLQCSAMCGPVMVSHVDDLLDHKMLTEAVETLLVDDSMIGTPTEFTMMIKIQPGSKKEAGALNQSSESLEGDSFKFVAPLNSQERFHASKHGCSTAI